MAKRLNSEIGENKMEGGPTCSHSKCDRHHERLAGDKLGQAIDEFCINFSAIIERESKNKVGRHVVSKWTCN